MKTTAFDLQMNPAHASIQFHRLERFRGRTLTADDITHYHRIVVALHETIRLMAEIDRVIESHGGWPAAFTAGEQG